MEGESIAYRVRLLSTPSVSSEEVSRWLCRNMNLPCERGPEGRYDFDSMVKKNRRAFSKFNPHAQPPDENAPLAPLRVDVPLIDPCSGQLSAGAQAHLQSRIRTPFIDRAYTASDLWVPSGARDRPQTPPTRPSALLYDRSDHNRWNSRIKLEAASRARLEGWTSAQRINSPFLGSSEINGDAHLPSLPNSVEKAAQQYIYTSTAQRGYEDVDWDSKLPPRHKPPTTTLEKMADPVSQHSVLKRYCSRPELWQQAAGSPWSRHQMRATFNARKPISFYTVPQKPFLASHRTIQSKHQPMSKNRPYTFIQALNSICGIAALHSGTVGSENMDGVDTADEDFIPLTVLRTTVPPQTPTSYRYTIPGYTGKARFDRPQTTAVSVHSVPYSAEIAGSSPGSWSSPVYGHKAPISRMVTTVSPGNPYLHPQAPKLPVKYL